MSEKRPRSALGEHGGSGHRERLRRRLLDGGAEALADYEVLEYLLFAGRRQGDTKPTAKALLARFGSLAAVLNADHNALAEVEGMGEVSAAALKAVALAARRMARSEVRSKPVLGSWQALLDYLMTDMAHLTVERVRVLYLDARNRLILDHQAQEGTIDEAAIHPREVVKKALEVGATALILVHNHPSGDPTPSPDDVAVTRAMVQAGKLLDVDLLDHLVIGHDAFVSLRDRGVVFDRAA